MNQGEGTMYHCHLHLYFVGQQQQLFETLKAMAGVLDREGALLLLVSVELLFHSLAGGRGRQTAQKL